MSQIQIHTPAPEFELADFTGRPFRLSEMRGRPVVLVFNRGFV